MRKYYRLPYKFFVTFISMRFLIKRVKQVQKYLVNGVFTVVSSCKIIYKSDHKDSVKLINSYFGISLEEIRNRDFLQSICSYLINKQKKTKKARTNFSFQGTIILFSNKLKKDLQYGDLKIFDISNKEILTSYYTKRSYDKKLNDTRYFDKYFNIPKIKESCDNEWVTIEELIEFTPKKGFDANSYLETTKYNLKSHIEYFRHCFESKKYSYIKPIHYFEYEELHKTNKTNLDIIQFHLGDVFLGMNTPIVYQHGDLSYSNILLTKNGTCYIIDWEHASEFTLLYDIMWPWQSIAVHNQNYLIIESYLNGVFDEQMRHIFLAFNLKYDPNCRIQYFLLMMAELVYHRVLKNGPGQYNGFLNDNIMPMIDKVVLINKRLNTNEK